MDAIDAVGVLADLHARILLLLERGQDHDAIAARLALDPAAVPGLVAIAQQKLAELEVGGAAPPGTARSPSVEDS